MTTSKLKSKKFSEHRTSMSTAVSLSTLPPLKKDASFVKEFLSPTVLSRQPIRPVRLEHKFN